MKPTVPSPRPVSPHPGRRRCRPPAARCGRSRLLRTGLLTLPLLGALLLSTPVVCAQAAAPSGDAARNVEPSLPGAAPPADPDAATPAGLPSAAPTPPGAEAGDERLQPRRSGHHGFTVGPSLAGWWDPAGWRPAWALDLTWVPAQQGWPWWFSAGLRRPLSVQGSAAPEPWMPYVEFGSWVFVTLGAGCSLALPDEGKPRLGLHAFAGLPVPLPIHLPGARERILVLEPYVRPGLLDGDGAFEGGLLLKYVDIELNLSFH